MGREGGEVGEGSDDFIAVESKGAACQSDDLQSMLGPLYSHLDADNVLSTSLHIGCTDCQLV